MSDKKPVEKKEKEKVLTKYDLKMQRRQEEKAKERRDKAVGRVAAVVILLALAAMIAYFPIKSYIASHEIYVTVEGEDISRVEFDFHYNLAADDYISKYGSYLSYFGLDMTADFAQQMYSDTLTWEDYFQELAVDDLKRTKALSKAAKAAGFTYDGASEIAKFRENVKKDAAQAGLGAGAYIRQLYGPYATLNNVCGFYEEVLYTDAYYKQVSKTKAASEEEIAAYYNENKADYDSVDYYMETVEAELPTEPTELADPVDPAQEDADGTQEAYSPSDAEIEKAMADAKEKAEALEATVAKTGTKYENEKKSETVYYITDWLFDDARKQGDTTVIENSYSHLYYVVSFDKRYLDDAPTVNLRVSMTSQKPGQDILDEWKAGAATEESFAQLCDQYSEVSSAIGEGGLIENAPRSMFREEIAEWLFAEDRAAGDATSITTVEGYYYVMYYIGRGDLEWRSSIADTLLNETMNKYMEELTSAIVVEDKNGKLKYLSVQAAEEAAKDSAGDAVAGEESSAEATE